MPSHALKHDRQTGAQSEVQKRNYTEEDFVNASFELEERTYLLDNNKLKSSSRGVKFRLSPSLKDIDNNGFALAKFGETVEGIPFPEGWVMISKDRFLPIELQGVRILKCLSGGGSSSDTDTLHKETEEISQQPVEAQPQEIVGPDSIPVLKAGEGALFEVVCDKVLNHVEPSMETFVQGSRKRGDIIELFDWDDTLRWRQVLDTVNRRRGWMILDHDDYGPMLRPQGATYSSVPLNPLCVSVSEHNVKHLRRFIDAGLDVNVQDAASGSTPIMVAAMRGHLDCCAVLLEARANVAIRTSDGRTAVDCAATGPVKALIQAISGVEFDQADFDVGIDTLRLTWQTLANRMATKGMAIKQRSEAMRRNNPQQGGTQLALQSQRGRQAQPLQESGVPFKVVYKTVSVHEDPDMSSDQLYTKKLGDIVELFGYDKTRCWGRIEVEVSEDRRVLGWIPINDENIGPLLRPLPRRR